MGWTTRQGSRGPRSAMLGKLEALISRGRAQTLDFHKGFTIGLFYELSKQFYLVGGLGNYNLPRKTKKEKSKRWLVKTVEFL